jgi:hypothetical protein
MTTPSHFRVRTCIAEGVDGGSLSVRIHERIEGTSCEGLVCTFALNLQAIPSLKAAIDRVFDKAARAGRLNSND